jgi:hypothetical protein
MDAGEVRSMVVVLRLRAPQESATSPCDPVRDLMSRYVEALLTAAGDPGVCPGTQNSETDPESDIDAAARALAAMAGWDEESTRAYLRDVAARLAWNLRLDIMANSQTTPMLVVVQEIARAAERPQARRPPRPPARRHVPWRCALSARWCSAPRRAPVRSRLRWRARCGRPYNWRRLHLLLGWGLS